MWYFYSKRKIHNVMNIENSPPLRIHLLHFLLSHCYQVIQAQRIADRLLRKKPQNQMNFHTKCYRIQSWKPKTNLPLHLFFARGFKHKIPIVFCLTFRSVRQFVQWQFPFSKVIFFSAFNFAFHLCSNFDSHEVIVKLCGDGESATVK